MVSLSILLILLTVRYTDSWVVHGYIRNDRPFGWERLHVGSKKISLHGQPRQHDDPIEVDRRAFLLSLSSIIALPRAANARGLVQFPIEKPLLNSYQFIRAGTSLLEEEDIWSTNPLFLTNREDALALSGQEQIVLAAQKLRPMTPTVIKYSLAASCMDTATILQRELKVGRDRILSEFTFLDPRAIGQWDMLSKADTVPAVWAMDVDEAGPDGLGARPPANEDGTPNETLSDQAIRLRQLLSGLESQYSGDTILLIFPDGTGPALLSAMMAGIPYNRVHELEFASGEVRLDVTRSSVEALLKKKQQDREMYESVVDKGRATLKELRQQESFVNLKDERLERERLELEALMKKKEQRRKEVEYQEEQDRITRQQEIVADVADMRESREQDDSPITPAFLGGFGLLTVGSALVIGAGSSAKNSTEEAVALVGDFNQTTAPLIPMTSSNATTTTRIGAISMQRMSEPIGAFASPNQVVAGERTVDDGRPIRQRINGDSQSLFASPPPKILTKADRAQAADRAMQEYLDKDDGADDWLQSLAQILEEEDVDDDAPEELQ